MPTLAKVFDMEESNYYDKDKIESRPVFDENIVKPSQTTSYSIQKQTFNPKIMIAIRMISALDHGINF